MHFYVYVYIHVFIQQVKMNKKQDLYDREIV